MAPNKRTRQSVTRSIRLFSSVLRYFTELLQVCKNNDFIHSHTATYRPDPDSILFGLVVSSSLINRLPEKYAKSREHNTDLSSFT